MAKSKLNEQQKRGLLVAGVIAMIIVIGIIAVQVTRQEEARVEIPKQEVPKQIIPSETAQKAGAVDISEYLNKTEYWSGGVGESVNGTIVIADPNTRIVIFESDEDGKLYYTRITDMTDLYVGDAMATLEDFKPGMPITVMYEPYYVEATE